MDISHYNSRALHHSPAPSPQTRSASPLSYKKRPSAPAAPKILREANAAKKKKNISFIQNVIPPVTGCLVIDAIANPEELPDDGLNILAEGTFNSSMDAFELKLAPGVINGPRRERVAAARRQRQEGAADCAV